LLLSFKKGDNNMNILSDSSRNTPTISNFEILNQKIELIEYATFSSDEEDSCNDPSFLSSSASPLGASNGSIPLIGGHSNIIPVEPGAIPISHHLFSPISPVDRLVEEVRETEDRRNESMLILPLQSNSAALVPVEETEEFQSILETKSEPVNQIIDGIDEEKAKREFSELEQLSDQILTPGNGYGTRGADKMLSNNRDLIDTHNRYPDIRPWGHNIVTLEDPIINKTHGIPVSYVNASRIELDGQEFISSCAPVYGSFDHYWQMIFEQGSDTVVMLTKFLEKRRAKAHCYWPGRVGDSCTFGKVTIKCLQIETKSPESGEVETLLGATPKDRIKLSNASIVKRIFELSCGDETREISHFHYREWPDFGRPESTENFMALMEAVYDAHDNDAPIVTHCSAGVGRAGTFITAYAYCQKIIQDIEAEEGITVEDFLNNYTINVAARVLYLRGQRPYMVQSEEQYIFIKEVIATFIKRDL
jgi:protein tyrosine phosphatase